MTLDRSVEPRPAPVRRFDFPAVKRATLANGFTVLTAAYGSVPVTTARLVVDAGVARERLEQSGIAQLVARTIDAGTDTRDAERISWDLELLGAHFEARASWDECSIMVTAPSDRMPDALGILADLVINARFPDDEVKRARTEQIGEILQSRAEPRGLASDMIVRFIYGPNSTYGRSGLGEPETVERLSADDLRRFHAERFAPASCALILAGVIDERIRSAALSLFEPWRSSAAPSADFVPGRISGQSQIHIVHREGSVQSEIRAGHVGLTRLDPDYFPLQIMNALFGGAFTSRLNMNLREKQGWTYGVRSIYAFRRNAGPFSISTAVATDVTAGAVREIVGEIDRLQTEGPADAEVANMRDYLAGVMPLEVQTTELLSAKLSETFVYGLPDDYYQSYRENIARVTRNDVFRVARQHIHRDKLIFAIVGDAAQIETPLRELGIAPVQIHEIP